MRPEAPRGAADKCAKGEKNKCERSVLITQNKGLLVKFAGWLRLSVLLRGQDLPLGSYPRGDSGTRGDAGATVGCSSPPGLFPPGHPRTPTCARRGRDGACGCGRAGHKSSALHTPPAHPSDMSVAAKVHLKTVFEHYLDGVFSIYWSIFHLFSSLLAACASGSCLGLA